MKDFVESLVYEYIRDQKELSWDFQKILKYIWLQAGIYGIGPVVRTSYFFRYIPNCALKFLNQFRRNALKNQFKKKQNSPLNDVATAFSKCGTKECEINFWKTIFDSQT